MKYIIKFTIHTFIVFFFIVGCGDSSYPSKGFFETSPADKYLTVVIIEGHYDVLDHEGEINVSKSEWGNPILWRKGEYGWHGKDIIANYEWYAKGPRDREIVEEYLDWKKRN